MANLPFDRMILNSRERPLSTEHNLEWADQARTLRDLMRLAQTNREGFIADGFYAQPSNVLELTLSPGLAFMYDLALAASNIDGVVGLNDLSPLVPMYLSAAQVITLAAAPGAGDERYDLIEVKTYRRRVDTGSRDVLDVGTGVFAPTAVLKTLSFDLYGNVGSVNSPNPSTDPISVKRGIASVPPAAIPAVTSGYQAVAVVHVPNGTTVLNSKINDRRKILYGPLGYGRSVGGVTFTQTITNPNDVFAITYQMYGKPTSMKFGVVPIAGGMITDVRFYMIHGDPSLIYPKSFPTLSRTSGTGTRAVVPEIREQGVLAVNTGIQTALALAPSSLEVAVGQTVHYMDVLAIPITGTINVGDALRWEWLQLLG